MIAILLACGPADESVQREIGNIPPAQETEPEGTPESSGTPEPTPMPTVCADLDGETVCFTPPTPVSVKYDKLPGHLDGRAQEAEELAESNRTRGANGPGDEDGLMVLLYPNTDEEGSVETIKAWLDQRDIIYDSTPDGSLFELGILYTQLGPLSELTAVKEIVEMVPELLPCSPPDC